MTTKELEKNGTKTDIVGAWSNWSFSPPADAKKAFTESLGKLLGVRYHLIASREQMVNGVNYKFICSAESVTVSEQTCLVEALVYQPIKGSPVVISVNNIGPVPSQTIGSWQNWKFPASLQATEALT